MRSRSVEAMPYARERVALGHLLREVRGCRICADDPVGKPLPHSPRPVLQASASAVVLIAGQAPGRRVHESGVPFNDPSGDRLRRWMGIDRDLFYDDRRIAILPMGFCFPGQDGRGADLPPRRECAARWRRGLIEALPNIRLILAIGWHAQKWHLGPRFAHGLTKTTAAWRDYLKDDSEPRIFPLPHPSWRNNAWLKANRWFEVDALPALRTALTRVLTDK